MKIEHHISQLLYRYQCVTVPGFGAFLTEIKSAQLVEISNTFYPPKKVISFNVNVKNNDGLLANHIAQTERLSYAEAVEQIEDAVQNWKKELHTSNSVSIKNIGKLSLNTENNIIFEPLESLNYLTDAFGLASFISPPVKREVYKKEVEVLEEKTPIQFTPEKRGAQPWLKYAAIFAVGLGMAGFFGNQWYNKKIATETLLVEKAVQQKIESKIQQATFFIENPISSVSLTLDETSAEEAMNYHVVAGAFRNEANAIRATQDLINLGYKAKKLDANKHGLFPVLIGSYPTMEAASDAKISAQNTHTKDAWILIQEIN
jgi:nucleoid DNA-binding protein